MSDTLPDLIIELRFAARHRGSNHLAALEDTLTELSASRGRSMDIDAFMVEFNRFKTARDSAQAWRAEVEEARGMVRIGWLVAGQHVLCEGCLNKRLPWAGVSIAPLFRDNIGDYAQCCHGCAVVLVEPKTIQWPNLFAPGSASCKLCEVSNGN